MRASIRPYADLLRLHFAFAWPLLFSSGFLLAVARYGDFSWLLLGKAVLIGLSGFLAGLVLNDWVDRDLDRRDVDPHFSRYWRPFGTRPLADGSIPPRRALALAVALALVAGITALTLPWPHGGYVVAIMVYSYAAEAFYQVAKRRQRLPVAQVVGRTDFALFPVAGYLVAGFPDAVAALYLLFFYPFALSHLGANDIADITNDRARGMQTIPVLYGMEGAARWVVAFALLHAAVAVPFAAVLGPVARAGLVAGLACVLVASAGLLRRPREAVGLRLLPLFHLAMTLYAGGIVLDYAL
ncbi:MAG: UbiA family prenyltransferase [Methanospirillum sp.]|nr:UbiA family prenyltransferase [Methanospirillum sp.]